MPDFQLTQDTLRRTPSETLSHLSAIYRVWQGVILDLGVERHSVTVALDLHDDLSIHELVEYVARAELESTLSETIHAIPTGMGHFQLANIRLRFGNLTAHAVATEMVRRWGIITGRAPRSTPNTHRETAGQDAERPDQRRELAMSEIVQNKPDSVSPPAPAAEQPNADSDIVAVVSGDAQPGPAAPIEPGPDGKVTLGSGGRGEKDPLEPEGKPESIAPPGIVAGDSHTPVQPAQPAGAIAPDGDTHSRALSTSNTVP